MFILLLVLNRSVLSAVEEVKKNITAVKARESQAETNWKDAQQEDHPIDYMMTVINRVSALTYLSGALHAKLARLYSSTSGQFFIMYSELHYASSILSWSYCGNQPYVCFCTRAQQ